MNERIRPVYKKKTIDVGRETVDSISVAPIARVFFEKEVSRKLHCWKKQMENLEPPPPHHLPPNQGWKNGASLAFARLHPWFGGGMGVCCSILFLLTDRIYHHVKGNSILSKSSKDSALFIQPRLSINLTVRQGIRENWQGRFFLILKRPLNW